MQGLVAKAIRDLRLTGIDQGAGCNRPARGHFGAGRIEQRGQVIVDLRYRGGLVACLGQGRLTAPLAGAQLHI